LFRGFMNN